MWYWCKYLQNISPSGESLHNVESSGRLQSRQVKQFLWKTFSFDNIFSAWKTSPMLHWWCGNVQNKTLWVSSEIYRCRYILFGVNAHKIGNITLCYNRVNSARLNYQEWESMSHYCYTHTSTSWTCIFATICASNWSCVNNKCRSIGYGSIPLSIMDVYVLCIYILCNSLWKGNYA